MGLIVLIRRGMAAWAMRRTLTTPSPAWPSVTDDNPSYNGDASHTQLTALLVSMLIGSMQRQEATAS